MWPPLTVPGAAEIKEYMLSYYHSLGNLTLEIVHLLAMGLGQKETYFDELFLHKPLSTLRLMHYPVRPEPIPEAAKKDGLVHTDTCFITLLSTFENKGLQILQQDGLWVDVDPRPDCLVMNAGDALVKTTGQFKATKHRVVDYGKERYSVPFFVEPNYYADIGRYERELKQSCTASREPTLYGPWLAQKLQDKKFSDYPNESVSLNSNHN